MTDKEAIAAVRAGLRAATDTTLPAPFEGDPHDCVHSWRTVACDFETDVIECWKCGMQMIAACNFDDDMA